MAASSVKYVGAIDQGTTSTRFILFTAAGEMLGSVNKEHKQHYPQQGARTCTHAHAEFDERTARQGGWSTTRWRSGGTRSW